MTASVLKQDSNTKRFTRTLPDTQHANVRGNTLYQATKRHLTTDKRSETMGEKIKKSTQPKQDNAFSFSFIFHRF